MSFDEKSLRTGIIGLGYVGGAILNAIEEINSDNVMQLVYNTYDTDLSKNPTCTSLAELLDKSDIIYIAVPTPMKSTGECDTSIIESVVTEISKLARGKMLVIKSTIPPGTTERLQTIHPNNTILFSPEFLTEANYLEDFRFPPVLLIGKTAHTSKWVGDLVLAHQRQFVKYNLVPQKVISATAAEFYKYIANTFLTTKVSFANEMSAIAQGLKLDWDELQKIIVTDPRLGKSHWKVPGPDGRTGYSGHCFPKDISALRKTSEALNIPTPVLNAVWDRNVTIDRPERDWENLKGRAVSE